MNDSVNETTMVATTVEIPASDLARARELGIDIPALICSALSERLSNAALDQEIERSVAAFADWAPADDWSDWTNALE